MNEILSKTREIEEIRFSGATIGCSGNFYKMLGIAINYILCEKKRNVKKKSDENLQKRQFPAYFRHFRPEKNFSQKSDSTMFWAFLKLMIKSRENASFSGIFPAFSAEKRFSRNRAPSHFRHWHFASLCQISWINVEYSSRNSRNTVFLAIFRKFRLQKSV